MKINRENRKNVCDGINPLTDDMHASHICDIMENIATKEYVTCSYEALKDSNTEGLDKITANYDRIIKYLELQIQKIAKNDPEVKGYQVKGEKLSDKLMFVDGNKMYSYGITRFVEEQQALADYLSVEGIDMSLGYYHRQLIDFKPDCLLKK